MRSLWVRLIGAFGLVILAGIGVVVFLASQATIGKFELYVTQTGQGWADQLAPALSNYYAQNGSWDGVKHLLQQPTAYGITSTTNRDGCSDGMSDTGMMEATEGMMDSNWEQWESEEWCGTDQWMMNMWTSTGNRMVLVDDNWIILADSAGVLEGTRLQADDIARGTPITLQGRQLGTIIVTPFNNPSTPAGDFLSSVSSSVLWAGITAGGVALVLGSILFFQITRPLTSLSIAAQGIADGDLNQRAWIGNHDEIGQVAHSFNQMADKLQNYEIERQNMIADIAHELRTPLSVIQGNLEAMLDNVLPAGDKELALLHQETILLNRLISDLRTLSQAEDGHLNLHKHSINLADVVDRVIERLQLRIDENGVDLKTTIPVDLPPLQADPDRLSQILSNLVENSLRYAHPGAMVEISAFTNDKGIQVSVIDNGPGISEGDLPKLFERFWRADKSRSRATGGSGLGLAIVKQLVTAHGGRVWAKNLPGKGVQFIFTLPG